VFAVRIINSLRAIPHYSKGAELEDGSKGANPVKQYHEQFNIGKAKYVVNYHDGEKTYSDGSPFFDIAIFRNEGAKNRFVDLLKAQGYVEN
jgi:hypothetical protein